MQFHLADFWETVAAGIPDSLAVIDPTAERTWRDYEDRAARLAACLSAHGLGHDTKIGIYAYNRNQYLETQFATFKIRAVPINVNYRYVEEELIYLLDNSDSEALVFESEFADRVREILPKLPRLKLLIQIRQADEPLLEGALDFESAIAENEPAAPIERSPDDIYMLYTGGTTGMPKGVMYRHGDLCENLMGLYDIAGLARPNTLEEVRAVVSGVAASGLAPGSLVACPLMHGTGMWIGAIVPHLVGGQVITMGTGHFDPDATWAMVEKHKASALVIVGDAFAKPLVRALDAAEAAGRPYDLSSMQFMSSSGVIWSAEVKEALLKHREMMLIDTMGSTEGGMGSQVATRDLPTQTAKFALYEGARVFMDDGRPVLPGSGEIGRVALSQGIPLGYYKDQKKTDELIKEIDGVRYSFPGDYATVESDGTITLLGRGSMVINTGGEKVFPEEVEEALKRHPAVDDCLVVGVPDERFGERVTAVLSLRGGEDPSDDELIATAREHVAGYKAPRQIIRVRRVERAPNGKADYKWAKETARQDK